MRGKGSIAAACAGLALLTSGCNLLLEEKLIALGIGTDLPVEDIAEDTRRLDTYFNYLCRQAGMARFEGEGELVCDMTRHGNASLTLLVRAGFNDIDRRCDSYLAWLNSRRRNRSAILSQIHDTRTFTEALLYTTGVGAAPIAIAGLAFGLTSNTFTNYYSRLLLEIEKSTVEMLVHEKRLQYRDSLKGQIAFQPDAVHVLREYLLICTPHYIENRINQRARDSISGNDPADERHADQIRKSVVSGALLQSIPKGPREALPPRAPSAPKMAGGSTEVERELPKAIGVTIQANLCVVASGEFDTSTREAIRQAKLGANGSRIHLRAEPVFRSTASEFRSPDEIQIFLDARHCTRDSSGKDRGYKTAFEKFRFSEDAAIKDLQGSLKNCDSKVEKTGIFDTATRNGIIAATSKTGSIVPRTDRLSDKAYEWVLGICL